MRCCQVICLLFLVAAPLVYGDDLHDQQKWLEDQFLHQILMVRNFYTEDKLVFSPKGEVIQGGKSDCWAAAQLEIKKVSLKPDLLTLEGNRIVGSYDWRTKKMRNYRGSEKVKVEVQLDPAHTSNRDILNVLLKIFLNRNDDLESLIPTASPGSEKPLPPSTQPAIVGQAGVQPPKVIFSPDPDYSKQARAARREGVTVLWTFIGTDGRAHDIRVVKCLGYGLDQQAVEAVSKWKFEPARKDGRPTAVSLNIQINFRCCN